jgi:hypothetical protein
MGVEGVVGHGDHPAARVSSGSSVGAELLEVDTDVDHAGLLGELSFRRVDEVLVVEDESARQRQPPFERWPAPADEQHLEVIVEHGEDDEIDSDGERGRFHGTIIIVTLTRIAMWIIV